MRAFAIFIAAAIVFPFAVHNGYVLQVVTGAFVTAISVYGLNVLLGYTGLLSLGHAAFFGIGAYGVALLETRAGWPFWPALLGGCAASVVLGFLVGVISLRTRGHYFSIFTAAIGVMINLVFTNWQDLTGGNIGIVNINPPTPIGPVSFDTPVGMYFLVLAMLVVAVAITARVRYSLLGRTFLAVAMNEDLARAVGIDTVGAKRLAFMLSTLLAGLAGGMYAIFLGSLGPDASGLDVTFEQLLYLIVGGLGTIAGPLVGTLVFTSLNQYLQSFEQYRMLIYGPVLVVFVMFIPGGIAGGFARVRGMVRGGRRTAARTALTKSEVA